MDPYVEIPKEKKETKVKFVVEESDSDSDEEFEKEGKRYTKTSDRRNTGVPLVKMPVEDESDDENKNPLEERTDFSTPETQSTHSSHHDPQDWKKGP